MSNNTDMVKKNSAGALSPVSLRSDAGKGTEELKSSDKSTVILKILHQLSPECNTRNAKYVQGAQSGMIYSGSMGTLIDGDKGLEVVVCHTHTRYPEWQERGDSAAAPVGTHINPPADSVEEKNGKYRLSNGNYCEKTMYFFVLALINGEARRAVITMRSSNLTPGRELNDLIDNLRMKDAQGSFKPAAFAAVFNLKTVGKNWGDKSWHVYKPSKVKMLDVSKPEDLSIYETAKKLQEEAFAGAAKPKYEQVASTKSKEDII